MPDGPTELNCECHEVEQLAADEKPVVAADHGRSGVGPIETSVVAFIIGASLLLILPATGFKPLGRNVLPTFFLPT